MAKQVMIGTMIQTVVQNYLLLRINLVKSIATNEIRNKILQGIKPVYRKLKDIPKTRLQIREFTLDPDHTKTLRNIINTKQTMDHLIWVSITGRKYRGMTGELGVDGTTLLKQRNFRFW